MNFKVKSINVLKSVQQQNQQDTAAKVGAQSTQVRHRDQPGGKYYNWWQKYYPDYQFHRKSNENQFTFSKLSMFLSPHCHY